eukprot:m.89149 g.89149  ORF g.89149 m.89149 type:complete len:684 (-) comp13643_c0_seq4:56-2107(-)
MSKFPFLFKELDLGFTKLRNRSIMGSIHSGLESGLLRPSGLDEMAAYMEARAKAGVGLIVTGGIAPNRRGRVSPFASKLTYSWEAWRHRVVTDTVHHHGAKICMQILHAGRYAYHPFAVSPSPLKAPISPFTPHALGRSEIEDTIEDFVRCAELARKGGYDGVEIMGSEGYLINQFIVAKTNKRTDEWGGAYENRIKFPLEIVRRTRQALGRDFIIIYRLSLIDLVKDGSTWEEVTQLARGIEEAGATIINSGIGWHEARVPTIATVVPPGAFVFPTARLRGVVKIPVVATNRINTPAIAEQILASGQADLVSMARPFLADPEFMLKAQEGRDDQINTCIACNQACLDHTFKGKRASCLVNPVAGYELSLRKIYTATPLPKRVAVVGAGPAGLSCAVAAARRGHTVTLFESADKVGGQFNLAKLIPGKEEFEETLRYYRGELARAGVKVELNKRVSASDLLGFFDECVLATGVTPRTLALPRLDAGGPGGPEVITYLDLLTGRKTAGRRVAVIGAGGIGYDIATKLIVPEHTTVDQFYAEWGVDASQTNRGGVCTPAPASPLRTVYLLQRKKGKFGAGLGKTTGWIHRSVLQTKHVELIGQAAYNGIAADGLHITAKGVPRVLPVDTVVLCAGQEPLRELAAQLTDETGKPRMPFHVIGGADKAEELDAKRAFRQGLLLAGEL